MNSGTSSVCTHAFVFSKHLVYDTKDSKLYHKRAEYSLKDFVTENEKYHICSFQVLWLMETNGEFELEK